MSSDTDRSRYDDAFKLIGEFLFHWNSMESSIDLVISGGFMLNHRNRSILLSQIQLRTKINIIKYFVDITSADQNKKKELKRQMDKISKMSTIRNIITHCTFIIENDADIVKFLYSTPVQKGGNYGHPIPFSNFSDLIEKTKKFISPIAEIRDLILVTSHKDNKVHQFLDFARQMRIEELLRDEGGPTPSPFDVLIYGGGD
ncbi:MAG: hypothetical protein KI792_13710 [Alphaproteobacteria bacterium]|nr:hypothetical protein [Alphaproteobacteria bacterium SS10]